MNSLLLSLSELLRHELPFDVVTHAGGDEYWHDAMTVGDFLPLACYGALALVVLVQFFIPALRRLYAVCFRFGLDLVGLRAKRSESAKLLADALARYLFTGGLCSLPLGIMLWQDTFRPSLGGPLSMGFAFVGLALTLLLLAAAFIIFAIWLFFSWQHLHHVEKVNPIATTLAGKSTLPS